MIYGWRARVGLILPADNVLMEPELYALGLHGVTFHGLRLTSTVHDEMRRQAVELGAAVRELGLDAVVYACAETSFNVDGEVRQSLSDAIKADVGVPFITATQALLAAIEATQIRRISLFTPYKPVSGEDLTGTLEEAGIEVVTGHHRDFREYSTDSREWYATNREPSGNVYRFARGADHPDSEGLVVVSTNLNTLAFVRDLELDLEKPVLTSNQSIVWWCARTLGIHLDAALIGSLAERPLPSQAEVSA